MKIASIYVSFFCFPPQNSNDLVTASTKFNDFALILEKFQQNVVWYSMTVCTLESYTILYFPGYVNKAGGAVRGM